MTHGARFTAQGQATGRVCQGEVDPSDEAVTRWDFVRVVTRSHRFGVPSESSRLTELRDKLIDLVRDRGLQHHETRVRLAAGKMSHYFIDGKRALRQGHDLVIGGEALLELVADLGLEFDAVGGLTNGADHLAHIVAVLADKEWFFVRKQAKDRGTRQRIEGAVLADGVRVLLVDDVVTSGGSIMEALGEIEKTGARIAGAISLVDRDDVAAPRFASRGIPYAALVTFRDLDIPSVSEEPDAPGLVAG
ncbi:MAG: orotate phosphoribosyltransferase [Acidimicrobiales bacterium]